MDAAAAAAAVADYRSNGEEGRRRSGSKMRGDAMRGGGTVARIQCGVAMCRARGIDRDSASSFLSSLLPKSASSASRREKERERGREGKRRVKDETGRKGGRT